MPLRIAIIPQFGESREAVKPTGKDGRSGPSLEGGSTKQFRLLRSPECFAAADAAPASSRISAQVSRVSVSPSCEADIAPGHHPLACYKGASGEGSRAASPRSCKPTPAITDLPRCVYRSFWDKKAIGSIPIEPIAGSSLGTYANSSSPQEEEQAKLGLSKEAKAALRIINRFALQDTARNLLGARSRVSACLRYQAFGHEGVRCYHIPKRKGARLGGLQTCGSVWVCPICSAKITERRRVELRAAVDAHRAGGGEVVLVTYTFSHHLGDDLAVLHEKMMLARSRSMSGAPYQRVKKLDVKGPVEVVHIQGSVRAVELTHGENGWHPHIHELLFLAPGADISLVMFGLGKLWHKGVAAAGLMASGRRGFHWTEAGDEVENYLAKWGHEPTQPLWDCAAELTKQPAKLGRVKGRTPFQLLADFKDLEGSAASAAGALFQEYAAVMHGKRQLEWSRWDTGERTEKNRPKTISFLTHLLGVEELSDEETAEKSEDDGLLMALLAYPAWRVIVADGRRAELWNLLREGDMQELTMFLAPYVDLNSAGRHVSIPLPRLVKPGSDERDKLRPVGYDSSTPWDALQASLGAGADAGMGQRLYQQHLAGEEVFWFTDLAERREQQRFLASIPDFVALSAWARSPALTASIIQFFDRVETAARPSLAADVKPPFSSGRSIRRKGGLSQKGGDKHGA